MPVALRGYAVFVLFSALSSTFWVNLGGAVAAAAIAVALTAVSAVLYVRSRRRFGRISRGVGVGSRAQFALLVLAAASVFWSGWPVVTALTGLLFAMTTLQGTFLGSAFSLESLTRCLDHALRWVVGLSAVFEIWVGAVVRAPLHPNFSAARSDRAEVSWVQGNLFDGGRVQGIVGNANTLGILCVLSLVVVTLRVVSRRRIDVASVTFFGLAGLLLFRSGSVTSMVALVVSGGVLALASLRLLQKRSLRVVVMIVAAVVVTSTATILWIFGEAVLNVLGRSTALTGRVLIWEAVLDRAIERPFLGHGYASPWLPIDPAFSDWIIDHDQVVLQAHSMWVDMFLQLGAIGVLLTAAIYVGFWVTSLRFLNRATVASFAIAAVPFAVATLLLVQGLVESGPMITWAWMLLISFTAVTRDANPPARTARGFVALSVDDGPP